MIGPQGQELEDGNDNLETCQKHIAAKIVKINPSDVHRSVDLQTGHRHIPLKALNVEFDFDVRFSTYVSHRLKPNIKS